MNDHKVLDVFKPEPNKRVMFLETPLDLYDMEETLALIKSAITKRQRLQHVVVNVAKLVNMRSDDTLRRDVVESDVINIDGAGIAFGCRLTGVDVKERVTGIDLMQKLLGLCEKEGYRPFFFGAKQEILDKAIGNIRKKHPKIDIAGTRNGYFKEEDELKIFEDIRDSKADCLFIAISSPVKENFMYKYRDKLGVPFLMGVGGSIDVIAGYVNRAPLWMQKWGLEWFYRLCQEPKRMWRRYLVTNSKYLFLLLKALISKG